MNQLEFICEYCNHSWQTNYKPNQEVYCSVCKDKNIKVIDLARSKIDYYQGCPPFPDDDSRNGWTI